MCFDSLLADRQGIELFRKYLENVQDKQGTKLIGMWLIYEGKFINIIWYLVPEVWARNRLAIAQYLSLTKIDPVYKLKKV